MAIDKLKLNVKKPNVCICMSTRFYKAMLITYNAIIDRSRLDMTKKTNKQTKQVFACNYRLIFELDINSPCQK